MYEAAHHNMATMVAWVDSVNLEIQFSWIIIVHVIWVFNEIGIAQACIHSYQMQNFWRILQSLPSIKT